jgi:integrase
MSLTRAKSGAYYYDFWFRSARYSGPCGTSDRRRAQQVEASAKENAKLQHAISQRGRDAKGKVRDVPFDQLAEEYWRARGQHAADALKGRAKNLHRLVQWIGPDTMSSDIDDAVVTRLVNRRRAEFDARIKQSPRYLQKDAKPKQPRLVSPAEVNRSVTELLKAVLNFGVKNQNYVLPDMPNWQRHILKEPKRQREMKFEEREKLALAIREDYAQAYDFAVLSGLRRREVVSLNWSQVDLHNGVIRVVQKGDEPHIVSISPKIRVILLAQQGHHADRVFTFLAQRTYRNTKANQHYVKGQRYPLNYETFGTMWRRFRERAGVLDLRIHDLRHTYASQLLRQVKDLRVVQQALGHGDISTTERYAHVLQESVLEGQTAAEQGLSTLTELQRSQKSPKLKVTAT